MSLSKSDLQRKLDEHEQELQSCKRRMEEKQEELQTLMRGAHRIEGAIVNLRTLLSEFDANEKQSVGPSLIQVTS